MELFLRNYNLILQLPCICLSLYVIDNMQKMYGIDITGEEYLDSYVNIISFSRYIYIVFYIS